MVAAALLALPWRHAAGPALAIDGAAALGVAIAVLLWPGDPRRGLAACGAVLAWLAAWQVLGGSFRLGVMPAVVALPALAALRRAAPGRVAEARVAGAGWLLVLGAIVLKLALPGAVFGLALALFAPPVWAVGLAAVASGSRVRRWLEGGRDVG